MIHIIVVFVYCGGMEPDYNIFENAYMEDLNNTTDKFALNVTPNEKRINTFFNAHRTLQN